MVLLDSHKDTCFVVLGIFLELDLISHTRFSLSVINHSRLFCYQIKSHIGIPQPFPTE